MMPVYASFDCQSYNPHLTRGRRYEVLCEHRAGICFTFKNDVGEPTVAFWKESGHLYGGDWTRHEEPDAPATPQPAPKRTKLALARAANGGWNVHDDMTASLLGAYSNTDDLLAGLRTLLGETQ